MPLSAEGMPPEMHMQYSHFPGTVEVHFSILSFMDPIGGAASLITLINTAVKAFSLVQSYQDAPREIEDLRLQLDGLKTNLLLLRHVQSSVSFSRHALALDSEAFNQLRQAFKATTIIIKDICHCLEKYSNKTGRSAHIKWAIHDSSKVKGWQLKLRRQENTLQLTLNLLNQRYSSLYEIELQKLKDQARLQTQQLQQLNKQLSQGVARLSWAVNENSSSSWVMPHFVAIHKSICCTQDSKGISYSVSLRLHALFCLRVFCIDFTLRRQSLFSVEVSAIGVGVVLKNVVPDDAGIMTACQVGDLKLVQSLLNQGKASVNDITTNNFSPLSYAIASGSVDTVMFLVGRGADPKQTFGRSQTGPLEWAFTHRKLHVACWLLSNEADVHHISARGWTPAFGLFGDGPIYKAPCDKFLDSLAGASFGDFDAQDGEGWSAMHRAAAYGTAEQIKCLIYRGASLETRTRGPGWTPAFCAVQFNNMSTLKEMIESDPRVLEVTDFFGWTLLHHAISSERLGIMRFLVLEGANLHALTLPTMYVDFDELENRPLTPMDIARAHGSLIFQCYLEALGAKGHKIRVVEEENAGLPDVFWDIWLPTQADDGECDRDLSSLGGYGLP
ncbi:hypothetical protein IFR05_001570 [Cadophora sp. M221]|nr:hypothetical protein IFR05_001570 [Cadophora sp. M221]